LVGCLHDWSVAMEGHRTGWKGEVVALYVSKQPEYMGLCWGVDEEPIARLWVQIKERRGEGNVIVGISYRPP